MSDFWYDQTRNLLIYPSAYSSNIQQAIPEARTVNSHYLAVPRTLRNCQVLRHFNYPVIPFVTEQNYDFPIEPGRKPLPHQKVYTNFQVLHPRSFNLGDPGSMKSLAALWTFDFLRRRAKTEFRALVVAPLTLLETVWQTAVFTNFLDRMSCEIITGSAEKRRALLAKKADISLINYEGVGIGAHTRKRFELDGLSKDIAERDDIKMVIIDEARAYADAQTKRHRIARLTLGNRPFLYMLTGTPMSTAPTDAYGLAKLMNNAFGRSFRSFQDETMIKVSQFKWVPRGDGYEKARRYLVPAVRFALEDVWNGPPSTTQQRLVELTDQQKKLMAELKRDLVVQVKGGKTIAANNEGAARQKFIQISLGSIYDENHVAHHIDVGPRYREVEDIIESTARKVVVFIPLTSVIDRLHKHLSDKYRGKWKVGVLNGPVPHKDRPLVIKAFKEEPDFKVILVDPGLTAHGINDFVLADTAIWMGATDKVDLWIQGNRRLNRPGQTGPTTIFQIVSNRLEAEIFKRCETNTSLQGLMLEAVERGDF